MDGSIYLVHIVSQYFSQVVSPYTPAVVKVIESHYSRIIGIQTGRGIDTLIIKSKRTAGICQVDDGGRKVGAVDTRVFLAYLFYQLVLQP